MDLPEEVQNVLQRYKNPTRTPKVCKPKNEDLIDIDEIYNLSDDQTWLIPSKPINFDLKSWLHDDRDEQDVENKETKVFDSRTFTRPKKKSNRPSLDKYNDEYYDRDQQQQHSLSKEIDKYINLSHVSENGSGEKPVHFDLTQPIQNNSLFEKISSTSTFDLDSFQNMSPPSLVNSMCSSTFTNLMENSYIKNDPALREIRDADYSHMIFSPDCEPPLYQSITESCSSINTEVAESFVRKTLSSLNGSAFSQTEDAIKEYERSRTLTDDLIEESIESNHLENIDPNRTFTQPLNGTFVKNRSKKFDPIIDSIIDPIIDPITHPIIDPIIDKTIDKVDNEVKSTSYLEVYEKERLQIENLDKEDSDEGSKTFSYKNNSLRNQLNNTFQKVPKSGGNMKSFDDNNVNCAFPPKINNFMENKEAKFNATRRLSDEIDDFLTRKLVISYDDDKDKYSSKRLSTGSTDSMDRLSSLSNSSRDSKLMADVDAIVEQQERSLRTRGIHTMSTPKPAKSMSKLFEHPRLSPIPNLRLGVNKEHSSDSEISSEEFYSMRTTSSQQSLNKPHRTFKSLSNLKQHDANRKIMSLNTTNTIQKSSSASSHYNNTGSSYENLKNPQRKIIQQAGSATNLRTLSSNLKGSYTNLKPRNANLPDITSNRTEVKRDVYVSNSRESIRGEKLDETFKVPQATNGTFLRPKTKTSNLPRPISMTGIPRPTSKIPAPRSTTR